LEGSFAEEPFVDRVLSDQNRALLPEFGVLREKEISFCGKTFVGRALLRKNPLLVGFFMIKIEPCFQNSESFAKRRSTVLNTRIRGKDIKMR